VRVCADQVYEVLGPAEYTPRVQDPQYVGRTREYNPDLPRKKLPSPDRDEARRRKRLRQEGEFGLCGVFGFKK
jgi:hypothetical protein